MNVSILVKHMKKKVPLVHSQLFRFDLQQYAWTLKTHTRSIHFAREKKPQNLLYEMKARKAGLNKRYTVHFVSFASLLYF